MADTNNNLSLDQFKLTKGEADWHEKYNSMLDAVIPVVQNASTSKIFYGTDDYTNSGWTDGSIYLQIEPQQ